MQNKNNIKFSIQFSLTLLIHWLLLSGWGVAEGRQNQQDSLQLSKGNDRYNSLLQSPQHPIYHPENLVQHSPIMAQIEAIENWEAARLKWQKLGDQSQEALTLLKLAETYKNMGAITPALERYQDALILYQELNNPLQEAFTLSQIGEAYAAELEQLEEQQRFALNNHLFINSRWQKLFFNKQTSNHEIALDFYQKALKIYQEINNSKNHNIDDFVARQGEANVFNKIAQLHNSDHYEKQQLLQQSLAIYQEIGDQPGEALILGDLSELNWMGYQNEQAGWERFNQATAIYQEIAKSSDSGNLTTRQAEANLLKMAADYWWSENQRKALEFYHQSLQIYREIGDKQGEAKILINIGDHYAWLENREKQLDYYTQALLIYQEIEDRIGEAEVLDNLGNIYSYLDELEQGIEFYHQALEIIKEVSQFYSQLEDSETALTFDYRQPIILFKIGHIYSQLSENKKELEAYNQARNIYQKWEDEEGEASFLIEIAERYGRQENSERMLAFFNHAVMVYREKGNRLEEANLLHRIAVFNFNVLHNSEKGFETLNQELKIHREIGNLAEVAQTLKSIASFYLDLGNKEKALEFYSKAVIIDRELKDFSSERFTLTRIGRIYYELGNKEKALEIFNQAGTVHQDSGEYEKAVNTLIDIAQTYTKWGEKETALKFYLEVIPISKQLGDYKREALTLRTIGQLYYQLADLNKAVETFNQARKVYQKNSDYSGEAWTTYEIGKSYTSLGDLKRAIESYQQALPIYEQEIDAPWREERTLDILIRMSRIYAYLGESEKSLRFCQKSLSYAQEMLQSKTIRNSERFREIGKLCYQIGETKIALESFKQYGVIYQNIGRDEEVLGLMRIAEDYTELGDSKQALEFFNRARLIYQESGFSEGEIDNVSWIGRVYSRAGNYQQALDYFNQGLRIAQKINNRSKEALMLTEIGDIYSKLEDEKALKFYNPALIIYQELGNYRKQAEILNKIGELYQQSENLEKALGYYQQALKIAQENSTFDLDSILRNIAELYFEQGELEKALQFFEKVLNYTDNVGYTTFIYTKIGNIYTNLGEFKKAFEFFSQSLDLLDNKYPEGRAENHLGLARIEREKGNLDAALTHIKTAINLIEETRTDKDSPEERLTFFASKQDYYEFYINLLMALHQQNPKGGYDAEALNMSERSKARNLLELLTEANIDIRKGVDPELVIQERSLQQQLDAVERRRVEIYTSEDDSVEQKTAIEQEQQYLLQKYEEVQAKIREKSPSYAAITQPQPLTLEQIQQQILDDETLLLQYFLGEKQSFVWAVTKDSITSYQLPAKELIEPAVREFFVQLISSRRGTFKKLFQASESLYQMILAPVENQLNYRRLAIVSDGILHYIPFSAVSLPTTSSDINYSPLVEKYEIVNLPSASTLSILRREHQQQEPAPKIIAVLADPVFSSEDSRLKTPALIEDETWEQYHLNRATQELDIGVWNRLPATRIEAEAILSLIPESESHYALDFEANRTAITAPEMSQYQIIHIATHGLFNSVNPELSGMILSMVDSQGNPLNGFLRLHDIFNLNFSADLVVLSACKTGLGKQVRGEGLVGLTRGFMYAGTPRILVSLWNVDDAATAEMMTRFYRLMLTEKSSASAALRQAQLEMQTETEWKSPYYWAGFILQGEWKE